MTVTPKVPHKCGKTQNITTAVLTETYFIIIVTAMVKSKPLFPRSYCKNVPDLRKCQCGS